MAELTIRPDEIRDALEKFVANFTTETSSREELGTVVSSGDGIAKVEGLPSAMANELLEFENGTRKNADKVRHLAVDIAKAEAVECKTA